MKDCPKCNGVMVKVTDRVTGVVWWVCNGCPHKNRRDSMTHYVKCDNCEPEDREWLVEKDMVAEEDPVAMPLEHPCQLCGRHPATVCTTCYDEAAQRTVTEREAVYLLGSCREGAELVSQLIPILHDLQRVLHTSFIV